VGHDARADVRVPPSALGLVQQALVRVHTAVGLRATLQAIAEGVTSSTPFQAVSITIAEAPFTEDMRVVAVVGSPEATEALLGTTSRRAALLEHLAAGEAWGELRFRSGYETTEGTVRFVPEYEPLDGPDAWQPDYELDAPLYAANGELIGMLSMDEPRGGRIPPAWSNGIVELFAEQAVIAIVNAWRHEEAVRAMEALEREKAALSAEFAARRARVTHLRDEARRDPLTGLANRVRLQERLEELLAAQIPIAVVFCDLDRFKQINDTHGHAVGDEVLRATGRRLSENLRDADVVARIGGDEFVVVAAEVQRADAPKLLKRVERAFSDVAVCSAGLNLRVASSLGLVCEPGRSDALLTPAQRVEELLSSADREMYAHKRSRARVHRLLSLAATSSATPETRDDA
jgi:diguanylate cyclase (GGDEF)-like protein